MGIVFSEGSGLQNSVFGLSQEPIKMFLEERGEAFEQQSMLNEIFCMEKSNNAMEKITGMTGMRGFLPTGEGGAAPRDSMQEGFSKVWEHMVWRDQFEITREMIDDAKTMDLKGRPGAFIKGYYRTRERFGAALLGGAVAGKTAVNFGGKNFDATGADKLPMFHKAHPSAIKENKKTQSNQFADAFSVDALSAMESEMQGFKGDNDEILDVVPDTIIIGTKNWKLKRDVFAALGSEKVPDSNNNNWNFQFGRWNVILWSYLDEFTKGIDAPWIMMSSQYNKDYFANVWWDRVGLEVTSEIDLNTHINVWDGYARFTAGFNDWRAFAVGGISGGTKLINE